MYTDATVLAMTLTFSLTRINLSAIIFLHLFTEGFKDLHERGQVLRIVLCDKRAELLDNIQRYRQLTHLRQYFLIGCDGFVKCIGKACQKLGQPVPLSYLRVLANSGVLQAAQT